MSTMITSLLSSLHTHLQSQTQLLPTLHNQLGLPPTALHDELVTLQEHLTQCIESQIDLRRKQVDEWTEKCALVEEECLRYGRALGGHLKTTGPSVGEIRKEQILPRRFELISDFQEKLRQQYHTKLEQLSNLTGRISALANTLGYEFYQSDILEPSSAPGEDESDSTSHRDVTPERFSRLEKELVRGKAEITKRLNQLSANFVQIDWLYTELGITPPSLDDLSIASSPTFLGLPSQTHSNLSCSNNYSNSDPFLSTSDVISMSTPTPASRLKPITPLLFLTEDAPRVSGTDHQRIFAKFVARMEELSDENLPEANIAIGLEGVEATPALMAWAEATRSELEETKRRREAHIQAMYDQLEALWRRLGVSERDMDAFVEAQRGTTDLTIKAYEEELERMLELKRERMGTFIENARIEIEKLWNELMVGEDERADFAPFVDNEHTEELLSIHEEEIKRLKDERRLKGPLLASIRKYFDICDDEKELAAAASDQSRLLGRGPRDPGRLLREEKMRKRVTKEKPRLEQDLLVSIPAWEAETRRPFLVHGMSMLQLLMETVSAADKENGNKRGVVKGRAGSVPPRSTTPANGMNHLGDPAYGHGGKSGAVTPALRPASSFSNSHSVPNKRPRLGESTNAQSSRAPLGNCGPGVNVNRALSPTRISFHGKTPIAGSSSLPRPVPTTMPIPKPGTAHHALGHGRVPSAQQLGLSQSYHPYHVSGSQRAVSYASSSSSSHSRYAAAAAPNAVAMAKKASRARRESFKPRPSVDEDWAADAGLGGHRRWAGFPGAVKEEDEEY